MNDLKIENTWKAMQMIANSNGVLVDVLGKRLIVEELNEDIELEYGIIIPEVLREAAYHTSFGLVHCVGRKVEEDVVPGDLVIYEPFSGLPVNYGPRGAMFVWEKYLWGVLTGSRYNEKSKGKIEETVTHERWSQNRLARVGGAS